MTTTPPARPHPTPTEDTAEPSPATALAAAIKPRLRGWLHLGTFPAALVGGLFLVAFGESLRGRVAAAVYVLTAGMLFGISATYHRGSWGPRWYSALKRLDHANIFLIIAGTYTPFAVLLLEGRAQMTLLVIVWTGATAGVVFQTVWPYAPRWLTVPIYIALGWVAVFYVPAFYRAAGADVVTLLALGGLCYSIGALVYGVKRPNPSPRWFGFHEVFHAFTLAAFLLHYAAVAIAVVNYS